LGEYRVWTGWWLEICVVRIKYLVALEIYYNLIFRI
jgi:hypothetical protein